MRCFIPHLTSRWEKNACYFVLQSNLRFEVSRRRFRKKRKKEKLKNLPVLALHEHWLSQQRPCIFFSRTSGHDLHSSHQQAVADVHTVQWPPKASRSSNRLVIILSLCAPNTSQKCTFIKLHCAKACTIRHFWKQTFFLHRQLSNSMCQVECRIVGSFCLVLSLNL